MTSAWSQLPLTLAMISSSSCHPPSSRQMRSSREMKGWLERVRATCTTRARSATFALHSSCPSRCRRIRNSARALSSESNRKGDVLAKRISASGLCSRREAVRLILEARVYVNGRVVVDCSTRVNAADAVAVDGNLLEAQKATVLIMLHKPPKVLTTSFDPAGRTTVFDLLPPQWSQLRCVGRLDYMTEGLLLLTNDGALKRRLELPATGIEREYTAKIHAAAAPITLPALEQLAWGTNVRGVRYGPITAKLLAAGHDPGAEHSRAAGEGGSSTGLPSTRAESRLRAGRREGWQAGAGGGLDRAAVEEKTERGAKMEAEARQCWVSLVLKEGKNREIRRVMEHKGWRVSRLIRTRRVPLSGCLYPCMRKLVR